MTRSKTRNSKRDKKTPLGTQGQHTVVAPARPGGKLGVIVDRLATKTGATATELAESTGWQQHSLLGALSRLRARGFVMRLEVEGDRKAYRLNRARDERCPTSPWTVPATHLLHLHNPSRAPSAIWLSDWQD